MSSSADRKQLEETCAELGRELAKSMPSGTGFAFLMFDFGDGGSMAYTSNAERPDMIKALLECAAKLAEGMSSPVS